jgi:hypothetical protein
VYAGALVWVVFISFFYLYVVWTYAGLGRVVSILANWLMKLLTPLGEALWILLSAIFCCCCREPNQAPPIQNPFTVEDDGLERITYTAEDKNIRSQAKLDLVTSYDPNYNAVETLDHESENASQQSANSQTKKNAVVSSRHVDWNNAIEDMGLSKRAISQTSFVFVFMFMPFIGQWLFWSGFVGLVQDE